MGLFLWKIKLYLEIEILSCLFPDFFLNVSQQYIHTHVCVYIHVHTQYTYIMSLSLKSVQTMAVHSLLLSDSLTLHRCHPQTRPDASVFILFLSENQTFLCVIQQRKQAAGRTNKEKDKRWLHLLGNKEHLHKYSTAVLLFIEQHCELWQCFILSKTLGTITQKANKTQ